METVRGNEAFSMTNSLFDPAALQQWLRIQGIHVNDTTAVRLLKTVIRLAPSSNGKTGN